MHISYFPGAKGEVKECLVSTVAKSIHDSLLKVYSESVAGNFLFTLHAKRAVYNDSDGRN